MRDFLYGCYASRTAIGHQCAWATLLLRSGGDVCRTIADEQKFSNTVVKDADRTEDKRRQG